MARARPSPSHNVASLKRALAEKYALLAEKEALLIERDRVIAVRDAELYAKTLQIEHLKAQLAVLRRARFGRSSEKLDHEIEQLERKRPVCRGRPRDLLAAEPAPIGSNPLGAGRR